MQKGYIKQKKLNFEFAPLEHKSSGLPKYKRPLCKDVLQKVFDLRVFQTLERNKFQSKKLTKYLNYSVYLLLLNLKFHTKFGQNHATDEYLLIKHGSLSVF